MVKKISIEGKVALVTGANRGIGRAIAVQLVESGASKVYACARDTSSLDDLKEECGDKIIPMQLDVTNDSDIASLKENASDVEILINNAGVLFADGFEQGNIVENMEKHFDVNVYGVIKVVNELYQSIKSKDEGAIATISSVAGLVNFTALNTYSVSKAAVHSVIQGLRSELKDSNVLVSGIYPGPIETDMTKDFGMTDMGSPQDVAKIICDGIENGVEDIFPDKMAVNVGELFFKDPKQLERNFQ